jgi:hypothetical protein
MPTAINPTYSHGGQNAGGFTAVIGTSTNSGRPVAINDAIATNNLILPAIIGFYTGTSCTVVVEGNGGAIDSTGNPPSGEWIDISAGGIALTNGQSFAKTLPIQFPTYRTRITAITAPSGNGFVSYVPSIITAGGVQASARYPRLSSAQSTS